MDFQFISKVRRSTSFIGTKLHFFFFPREVYSNNCLCRQLEPDNYTDLTLDTTQSDFFTELWDGERVSSHQSEIIF